MRVHLTIVREEDMSMRTRHVWILTCLVLLGALLHAGCQTSNNSPNDQWLTGSVTSADGRPIGQAQIRVRTLHSLSFPERWHEPVLTDKKSKFIIPDLLPGDVLLSVRAEGYKTQRIWVAHNANDVNIVLRLPSEKSIYTVQVVDDEGNPVHGAPVVLHRGLYLQDILTETSEANPSGIAEFSIQPSRDGLGYGIILCKMDGYDSAFNDVYDSWDCEVRLVLHRSREHWSGKVVDTNQESIENARFRLIEMKQRVKGQWLNLAGFPSGRNGPLLATSDGDGMFVLDGISKKDYVVIDVLAPGFTDKGIVFSPGTKPETIIQLAPRPPSEVERDV